MRLLLARHGETDWNAAGHIQGRTDIPLNETGRAQARSLIQRLEEAGERVTAIYTSPQKRALETAQIAGREFGLTPIVLEELRELSFGVWEGFSWDQVEDRWGAEYDVYQRDRLNIPPPEGECFRDLLERVLPVLNTLVGQGRGTALVISHSAVIKAVLCHREDRSFARIHQTYSLGNAEWVVMDRVCRPLPPSDGGGSMGYGMDYEQGINYIKSLLAGGRSGVFHAYKGIDVHYPGYKKNFGDYRLEIAGSGPPSHAAICQKLYDEIKRGTYTFGQLDQLLKDVYANGTRTQVEDERLRYYQNLIYWVTLQEEINFPRSKGCAGINLAYCRYYEAIYCAVHDGVTIVDVMERCRNHGSSRPVLYKIDDAPDYYRYR